jgi:16S rRNA (cytosine967-C5)-methyltransferase
VSGEKPREIALAVLALRSTGEFVEDLLERKFADTLMSQADRGLCMELVYGIVRWQATLDWLIARKTANRTQKQALQDLLRLGLYQIFWLDRIPNHAAVHVTVELAKRHGFGPQSGFVNALLRGYLREFDNARTLLKELKSTQPAIGFSHPEWLVERWENRWGKTSTLELLEWNNKPPRSFARVNTLKADAGKLLEQWRNEGVDYDFVRRDWFEENLVFELKSHPSFEKMPSFRQGLFYVQDPSTLLAVRELGPLPGESILDLCAAPGGKLTYVAQRMNNQGRVVAHDVAPERLKLIDENCKRLGVTCVQTASPEMLNPAQPFERILLDAPCSNTGVMRRRVDLRWRIRPEELERLRATQLELLSKAARLLKSGGILVYSTCSLEAEENTSVAQEFLRRHSEIKMVSAREVRPFAEAVDGGFVARFSSDASGVS